MSSMINYGLIFNIETLAGSFFVNSILMGGGIAGRKAVHLCLSMLRALSLGALPSLYPEIFITKTISAMEYYPTVVRNSGLAFKSTCSRLGTILAPQLIVLNFWEALPYIVLTVMAALDTVMYQVVIPETKGRPLPENLPPKRENNRANLPGTNSPVKV
ncbi:hypothetical protein OSTOST_22120 [Ostertagia ostertagi]